MGRVRARGVIQSPVLAGRDTGLALSPGSTGLGRTPFCNPHQ
jgi:hypothetical protein